MADVTTLTVRGEGGHVYQLDLPPEGTTKREIHDEFVKKGWIHILTDDELKALEPEKPEAKPAAKPQAKG